MAKTVPFNYRDLYKVIIQNAYDHVSARIQGVLDKCSTPMFQGPLMSIVEANTLRDKVNALSSRLAIHEVAVDDNGNLKDADGILIVWAHLMHIDWRPGEKLPDKIGLLAEAISQLPPEELAKLNPENR